MANPPRRNPHPFPPKTSMMWNKKDYTYEQAVEAYERDGDLGSLVKLPEILSEDDNGMPPPTSMFWEGKTRKTEPPAPKAPPLLDLTRPEFIGEMVHLVPVRYAIDQQDDGSQSPPLTSFGLPEGWKGTGGARLKHTNYTLRQLRDGWLYVYDQQDKVLDEYQIKGTDLIEYKLGESEDPSQDKRGTAQAPKPYLSYPEKHVITLIYTEQRWGWDKFLEAYERGKHIHLGTSIGLDNDEQSHMHIGSIETLTDVADIEAAAQQDGRFSGTSVKTKQDADDASDAPLKPVAGKATYASALPKDESSYVIAIHDYSAEIQDMALRFVAAATPYRVFEEQYQAKWRLMQTVMSLCMFGASDDFRFPSKVVQDNAELDFYLDLSRYYQAKENTAVANEKLGIGSDHTLPARMNAVKQAKDKETPLAAHIRKTYGLSPDDYGDKYKDWVSKNHFRKTLDWETMLSEMDTIEDEKQQYLETLTPLKQDFIRALGGFRASTIAAQCDLTQVSVQTQLLHLHQMAVEAFTMVHLEEDREWLCDEWQSARTLLPLYTAGFHPRLYKKIGWALEEMQQPPAEDTPVKDGLDNLGKVVSLRGKMLDFMTNPNTQETAFFKDLGHGFDHLDKIFLAASKALVTRTAEMGISPIAHATTLMLPMLTHEAITPQTSLWRVAMIERFALGKAVNVNAHFTQDFVQWKTTMNHYLTALQDIEAKIQGKVIHYSQALPERMRLKTLLKQTSLEFPQQIQLAPDVLAATKAMNRQIVAGQLNQLEDVYKKVGGFGFIGFTFYLISLGDALDSFAKSELQTLDEVGNLSQNIFYTLAAWSGFRTGDAWAKVKGNADLRRVSAASIPEKIDKGKLKNVTLKEIDSYHYFNKCLTVTAALGFVAAGIETTREIFKGRDATGEEQLHHYGNAVFAGLNGLVAGIQLFGASTGLLSANVIFGGPIMLALLAINVTYILWNLYWDAHKKDAYQQWVDGLPWGKSSRRTRWSTAADFETQTRENLALVNQALFELQGLMMQPVIYHKPVRHYTDLAYRSTPPIAGLTLHVVMPDFAAQYPIACQTSLEIAEADWQQGTWHQGVELETLKPFKPVRKNKDKTKGKTQQSQWVYEVTLPVTQTELAYPLSGLSPTEFALSITYVVSDESGAPRQTHDYYFYQSLGSTQTSTMLEDKSKQVRAQQALTSDTATIRNPKEH